MTLFAKPSPCGPPLLSRRRFAALAVLACGAPFVGRAEAVGRRGPFLIGALTESWGPTPLTVGLRDGLVALGYSENTDFVIGVRFTQGDVAGLEPAARELAAYGAQLIFASDANAWRAALVATERLPIVFTGGGDPIGMGLVRSFARPGGRATGVTDLDLDLAPKRLEIFRDIVPKLRRVVFVYGGTDAYSLAEARRYREAAGVLGVALMERAVTSQREAEAALARIKREDADGILQPRVLSLNIPGFAMEAHLERGVPIMSAGGAFWVERGALASYGADFYESGRQAARLVDKIIKGADPAQLPVETNPRVQLIINLKTARALKVPIPRAILYRADRLID